MVKPAGQKTATSADLHDDRRRHRRVDAPLKGRFLDAAGEEHPCLIANISAGGALIKAHETPAFGEKIVVYIDRVGRFEARVIRSGARAFAVSYERRRAKNAKTADQLTKVVNQGKRSNERRASPRITHDAPAHVIFEDGRTVECAILDISLTGASIQISPRPPLGTRLILGRMNAKVVRRHEKGVGVVFTGAAERMTDVMENAAPPPTPSVDDGAGVAKTFGRKVGKA